MLTLVLWVFLYWQNRGQLNQPNRRGTDPYARWCDRESPRGHTYVDYGTATYTPGPLKLAKTYYWRVDEFDAVNTYKGEVWNFTTQGAVGNPNPYNGAVDVKPKRMSKLSCSEPGRNFPMPNRGSSRTMGHNLYQRILRNLSVSAA